MLITLRACSEGYSVVTGHWNKDPRKTSELLPERAPRDTERRSEQVSLETCPTDRAALPLRKHSIEGRLFRKCVCVRASVLPQWGKGTRDDTGKRRGPQHALGHSNDASIVPTDRGPRVRKLNLRLVRHWLKREVPPSPGLQICL